MILCNKILLKCIVKYKLRRDITVHRFNPASLRWQNGVLNLKKYHVPVEWEHRRFEFIMALDWLIPDNFERAHKQWSRVEVYVKRSINCWKIYIQYCYT